MFDLTELAQADQALNALASGQWTSSQWNASRPAAGPQPRPVDITRCPYHQERAA